jgi:WD40 repeat protein
MACKIKPPSVLRVVGFPCFSICWYADPGDGSSYVAYSGGGGSARTGVSNKIGVVVNDAPEPHVILTGTKVGIAVNIYCNPISKKRWLLVSFESEVHRYSLSPDGCVLDGTLILDPTIDDGSCECLAVNAMTDRLALGCKNGNVLQYELSDESFGQDDPLCCSDKHTHAVCAVNFSSRGNRLLTCAKDGTTCVWREDDGAFLAQVTCVVDPPPPPRPLGQVMVRGCAFGDLDGNIFYTIASGRRGAAFLARWIKQDGGNTYVCLDRMACSACPVSAMVLSQDGDLLVLGHTDGNVTLWGTADWKPLKIFKEVHGFSTTGVAARPYRVRLLGEDDGVEVHARTVSADGTLALLTLQTRVPRVAGSGGDLSIMLWIHRVIAVFIFLGLMSPLVLDAIDKCPFNSDAYRCLMEDVLIAPAWRPGVSVPPY